VRDAWLHFVTSWSTLSFLNETVDSREVTQIAFKPEWDRDGKAAPFKRNDAILAEVPHALIVFPGKRSSPTGSAS
jgi:hypothetical protein